MYKKSGPSEVASYLIKDHQVDGQKIENLFIVRSITLD